MSDNFPDVQDPVESPEEESDFHGKLVPIGSEHLALPGVKEALARAQQREQVTMTLLAYSISRTISPDWIDLQGRPHPMTRAVISMLKTVGITATIEEVVTIRRDDGHYTKRVLGWAQQEGFPRISVLGKAFSRDAFFTTRYAEDDAGNRVKTEMPGSEVQEDDVEAKAVTNFYYRCLCACLGIKGLTWADLAPFGITPNGATARITWGDNKPAEAAPSGANGANKPAAAKTGNCPTCGKGTLRERKRKSDGKTFWACDNSKKNPKTDQYEGCRHMQDDPPAAPAPQPTPAATAAPQGDAAAPAAATTPAVEPAAHSEMWLKIVADIKRIALDQANNDSTAAMAYVRSQYQAMSHAAWPGWNSLDEDAVYTLALYMQGESADAMPEEDVPLTA